jgi:hypothetical protein
MPLLRTVKDVVVVLVALAAACLGASPAASQGNASQAVIVAGLVSASGRGAFRAATFGPNGNLYLVLDEHDGLRVLEMDAAATTVLAQAHEGAAGDAGIALALDPAGNVYVTGTTSSGTLSGLGGGAFPAPADTSTNSFLAKFDANLNPLFLTFLGAGRTSAAGVAATADAVFVTGITFSSAFPVTPGGVQQAPATGSSENGFVERFSSDGSALVYATYLTGVNGTTAPAAIAADASDDAYIAGSTSSSGYPTVAALVPESLGATSGFLTKLNPAGSGLLFSTFVPGAGITSVALDSSSGTLLLSGNIALGQFPVATVATPLTSASYQSVLRIPVDGQSVTSSVVTIPGSASFVTPAPDGAAWVSVALTTPLFPATAQPFYTAGDSALLHLTGSAAIDQAVRFGGEAVNDPTYASVSTMPATPAVDSSGTTAFLPMTANVALSGTLAVTEGFDLPLAYAPNGALPARLLQTVAAAGCGTGECYAAAGFLGGVETAASEPSLSLAVDDLPNLILRNLGSAEANGAAIVASGFSSTTNCGSTLAPGSECAIVVSGGPGSISVSAANAAASTVALPAPTRSAEPLALSASELDFGIVSSTSAPTAQTIAVTNLTASAQTFPVTLGGGPSSTPYTVGVSSMDCAAGGSSNTFTVAASSSCHVTFTLTAAVGADTAVRQAWLIGTHAVAITGFSQAAAVNLSALEIDFGLQFAGASSLRLPRSLYLSNNADHAVAHMLVTAPAGSPFTVVDHCPTLLDAHTVCQLALGYDSPTPPSDDAIALALDGGASVLVTGETLPQAGATGSAANPSLTVTPASLAFATPVVVSSVSPSTQTVTVTNTGTVPLALTIAVSGDFTTTSNCGSSLAAGASCQILVAFAPSQPGRRDGVLSVTGGSGFAPAYAPLTGTALPLLPANNGTLALGDTQAGVPLVRWFQVQQSVPSLSVTSSSAQFLVILEPNTGAAPTDISPAAFKASAAGACSQCWLGVLFLSGSAGAQSGSLTLTTTASGNPYVVTVSATALPVGGLIVSPVASTFNPVPVHSTSAPMLFTLANLVSPATTVNVQSVSVSGDFALAANNSGGASCSGALATSATCFVAVQSAPTGTGERDGALTIVTDQGTVTASLAGYGLADPGLALQPDALVFSNVQGSSATQQSVTLTNTGAATLTIGGPAASDPSFLASSDCGTLAPGASCTITVSFTPQGATVSASLKIPVTANLNGQITSATYTVLLSGSYTTQQAGLQLLPGEVDFGAAATGSAGVTRLFTLNNLTANALSVSLVVPRDFALTTASPCPVVAAGASCSFAAEILPLTAGPLTGTLIANGTPTGGATNAQALAYLEGYGTSAGTLTITGNPTPQAPLSFGQVTSGQSVMRTLTLTNRGSVAVTVRRVVSQPPFLAATTCGSTLTPGTSCTITLSYAPVYEVAAGTAAAPRTDAGLLTVESDAVSSPDTIALAGTAAAIPSPSPSSGAVIAAYALSQQSLTFPATGIGNRSTVQSVTLTNTGTTVVHALSVTAPSDFSLMNGCATLLPGDACSLQIAFAPGIGSSGALRAGAIEIVTDASAALDFLSVTGTAGGSPLTLSPVTVQFGTVDVGSSGLATVTRDQFGLGAGDLLR